MTLYCIFDSLSEYYADMETNSWSLGQVLGGKSNKSERRAVERKKRTRCAVASGSLRILWKVVLSTSETA